MEVPDSSQNNSGQIIQNTLNQTTNEKIIISKQNKGNYIMKCVHSGKIFDIGGSIIDVGSPLTQYEYHGGGNQQFKIEHVRDACFRIIAVHSGKPFEVQECSKDKGGKIIEWNYHNGGN